MAAEAERGRHGFPWRAIGWGAVGVILLLPLVTGAPWTLSDYVFMGVLLGGLGLGIELAARRGDPLYLAGAAVALAAAFLLVWVNAAVGIIGSEREDANLLFLGVLLVAMAGSAAALFRAAGMVWAMAAAAMAQLLVPPAAALALPPATASVWSVEVLVLTCFFTGLWLLSALLFRLAGR